MASDVAEFQRQAFSTCLEEVKPKLPVALASEFDQIRELIDDSDQVRKNVWSSSSSSSSLLPLLNDLNDALADCTIFADQCQEVNQTFSLLNPFHHTLFVRNMKQRLKTMNQELTHELGSELTNSSSPSIMPLFPSGRFTAIEASADYSQILGFEEQEEKIRDFLISDSNTSNAIGVYGMAGSGKTTLVLKVLNDPSVQNHFDQIIWLCLSDIHSRDHEDAEFFEVSIINFILCELGCDVDKWTEIHPTKDYLLNHLKKLLSKRYLIVFDDVWEDNEFYSNLGDALPVENRLSEALPRKSGGKIIMTSREKEVCKKMVGDEKNLICMQPLNRDICRKILELEIGEGSVELIGSDGGEYVSDDIVDLCAGLPFAAKTLANIINRNAHRPHYFIANSGPLWTPHQVFGQHEKSKLANQYLKFGGTGRSLNFTQYTS